MLKVFLDRGAKNNSEGDIVSVGCVVFEPLGYKRFLRPWRRMLRRWQATSFHATDFYNGAGEFKRNTPKRRAMFEEDAIEVPSVIGRNIYLARIISFDPIEFAKFAPNRWLEEFGSNVHDQAVQICLLFNGHWRMDERIRGSFSYFMEAGDPDCGQIKRNAERLAELPETGALIGVSSFKIVEKGEAYGTDAADFLAWHWNKFYLDKVKAGQWHNPRKDFEAFVRHIPRQKIKYSHIAGDKLKYLFSLLQTGGEQRSDLGGL